MLKLILSALSLCTFYAAPRGGAAAKPITDKKAEPLRKITIATVYGKPKLADLMAAAEKKEVLPIMDVWGIATRAREGKSDYGAFVRFNGQFRAMNLATGELFRAATMLLPRFLEEELAAVLADANALNAEFGVRITAKFDEDASTKYVYLADPIVEPKETAQLADLTERIGKARLALPAPGKSASQ